MSVQDAFNEYAARYDASRRKLIPCFDDFYSTAARIIPFDREREIRVLDLGAGTGLMSEFVAARFPQASIDLMDIAEKMLAEARIRLKALPHTFRFLVDDYAACATFGGSYDLIISALSIHHLSADEKQALFKKIFAHLTPGGMFINADQVLGETEAIDRIYRRTWIEQVEASGLSEDELAAAVVRMREDKMSPLSAQLDWLKQAGFSEVNCWFKSYSFAVFSGTKPTQ